MGVHLAIHQGPGSFRVREFIGSLGGGGMGIRLMWVGGRGEEGRVGHVDRAATSEASGASDVGRKGGDMTFLITLGGEGGGGGGRVELGHTSDLGGLILSLQGHDPTLPTIRTFEASALTEEIGTKALTKVTVADDGLKKGDEAHEERDDGEDGEIVLDVLVLSLSFRIGPDSDGLEEKVGNGAEEAYHEGEHHVNLLTTDGVDGGEKDEDDDGKGSDGEGEFRVLDLEDEHHELDGEADEEKDVEFKEHEEDMVGTVHAFLTDISADFLVDPPTEFLKEFPGEPEEGKFRETSDDNDDDEGGLKPTVRGIGGAILL